MIVYFSKSLIFSSTYLGNCTVAKQDKRGVLGCRYVAMRRVKATPTEELQLLLHYEIQLFFHEKSGHRNYNDCIISYNAVSLFNPDTTFRTSNKLQLPRLALRTAFYFGNLEQSNPIRSQSEKR